MQRHLPETVSVSLIVVCLLVFLSFMQASLLKASMTYMTPPAKVHPGSRGIVGAFHLHTDIPKTVLRCSLCSLYVNAHCCNAVAAPRSHTLVLLAQLVHRARTSSRHPLQHSSAGNGCCVFAKRERVAEKYECGSAMSTRSNNTPGIEYAYRSCPATVQPEPHYVYRPQ